MGELYIMYCDPTLGRYYMSRHPLYGCDWIERITENTLLDVQDLLYAFTLTKRANTREAMEKVYITLADQLL